MTDDARAVEKARLPAPRWPALRLKESSVQLHRSVETEPVPGHPSALHVRADIALRYGPHKRDGGDFADVFAPRPADLVLTIADVSGRDGDAVLIHHLIQQAVHALVRVESGIASALQELNRVLLRVDRRRRASWTFASAFVAWIERVERRLAYVCAGHAGALLLRAGGTPVALAPTGPVLGVLDDASYDEPRLELSGDDRLVLATGGVIDARANDAPSRLLGTDGLETIARAAAESSAPDEARAVLERVEAFAGGTLPEDAAVMIARCR